jgi:hypothetical protein
MTSATGPSSPRQRTLIWAVLAGGIALLGVGVWLVVSHLPDFLTPVPTDAPGQARGAAADGRRITATLFYVSDDARELVPVAREVPYGATPAEQAKHLVAAQLEPPPDGQLTTIPKGIQVKTVYLAPNGEAYVDLSREIVTGHIGGVVSEALTVYALVNVITTNLANVTAVQILVDGSEVDSLTGHIDLRHPLPKSLEWVRKGQ